jgi:hypothetical protein
MIQERINACPCRQLPVGPRSPYRRVSNQGAYASVHVYARPFWDIPNEKLGEYAFDLAMPQ